MMTFLFDNDIATVTSLSSLIRHVVFLISANTIFFALHMFIIDVQDPVKNTDARTYYGKFTFPELIVVHFTLAAFTRHLHVTLSSTRDRALCLQEMTRRTHVREKTKSEQVRCGIRKESTPLDSIDISRSDHGFAGIKY